MSKKNRTIPLGFIDQPVSEGIHTCFFYQTEEERQEIISKYIQAGLNSDEKVGYFVDMITSAELKTWLQEMGIRSPSNTSQLTIATAEETYCPQKKFVPEHMLNNLRQYYEQSLAEGFSGARATGEMSWALKGIPGSERLTEYEALINKVVITHPITALCQYDVNLFDGATIFDILQVHPYMIVRGQLVKNPAYITPDEFLVTKKEMSNEKKR